MFDPALFPRPVPFAVPAPACRALVSAPHDELPIETMASVLVLADVDLDSEAACVAALRRARFTADEIIDGRWLARDRAREIAVRMEAR